MKTSDAWKEGLSRRRVRNSKDDSDCSQFPVPSFSSQGSFKVRRDVLPGVIWEKLVWGLLESAPRGLASATSACTAERRDKLGVMGKSRSV